MQQLKMMWICSQQVMSHMAMMGQMLICCVQEYAARKAMLDAHAARQSTTVSCVVRVFA
jgi:hypothetical protein